MRRLAALAVLIGAVTAAVLLTGAKGEGKKDGEDGKKDSDSQMSTEAIAMAYLMRGVHF